jgi:Protein of unknown function (DUF3800)
MSRAPREPSEHERHLFHEIYIDETSQNDHHFLLLGGIMIPREMSAEFEADILEARAPRLLSRSSKGHLREMGWSEVSTGDFAAYRQVLDAFFSFAFRRMQNKKGTVRFYCSVVNTRVRGRSYSKGKRGQIGFNREIYFHCLSIARQQRQLLFHVYPDERSTTEAVEKLGFMMSRGIRMDRYERRKPRDFAFRRVKFRLSHEYQALQISDLLIGAIGFRLNRNYDRPNANADKKLLCDYVLAKTGFDQLIGERSFRQKHWGPYQLKFRRHKT